VDRFRAERAAYKPVRLSSTMVKQRNPGLVVLLCILTLGIYAPVASYLMGREVDAAQGSNSRKAMLGGLMMWILGIVFNIVAVLVVLVALGPILVDLVTQGPEEALETAGVMVGIVVACYLVALEAGLAMGILFTAGHARIHKAVGRGAGGAWAVGLVATLLMMAGNMWLIPFMPAWTRYLGAGAAVLVIVLLAMSASAANTLALGRGAGADAGFAAEADAAW